METYNTFEKKLDKLSVVIIGASGYIGQLLLKKLSHLGNYLNVCGTYNNVPFVNNSNAKIYNLNIINQKHLDDLFKNIKPNIVVHLAAISNLLYCENHIDEAYNTNVTGTLNVENSAKNYNSKVIYISTDLVFAENKFGNSYSEADIPNPGTIYGITKLHGEKIILGRPENLVLRLSNVFSPSDEKNFAKTIITNFLNERKINLFSDEYRCFISLNNAVDLIIESILKNYCGIYHICGNKCLSRYEFGLKVAKYMGLSKDLICETSVEVYNNENRVKRPKFVSLSNKKAAKIFNRKFEDIDDVIVKMVHRYT